MSVKSSTKLRIVPQRLVRDLTPEERNQNPILLDVKATTKGHESISFQLDIIFQSIAISRGLIVKSPFYVGTIGAEVTITATGAEVIDYTRSSPIPVQYTHGTQVDDASGFKVAPELGSKSVKAKVGSFEKNAKRKGESKAEYSSEEALLVATVLGDTIRWNIDTHRAEKVVRDFLIGNKSLNAIFKWKPTSRVGSIQIRPDIRFFDTDKRPLSRQASLMMRFVLWQRNFRLENEAGFQFSFAEAA
jgi:hypothetical protein